MKFTNFYRLRQAIRNLDTHFISKKIADLEDHLTKHGIDLEPENTAVTQEGIFYIEPESGMTTKVVLYKADHEMRLNAPAEKIVYESGYEDAQAIEKLHEYHLMRCNTLSHAESQGWPGGYRIAQRADGTYYYRMVKKGSRSRGKVEVYQEIENQKLFICPNCLLKANSLLEGVFEPKREQFDPKYFFDIDFTGSWCRYEKRSDETGSFADIYPKDWEEISRIRKEQVQFHCEACNLNLSDPFLQKYLYVHYTDHVKRKVVYVKLEALCIACLAEQPTRSHLKDMPDYMQYLKFLHRAESELSL